MTNVATSDLSVTDPVLRVRALKTYFFLPDRTVRAVDGVDLEVRAGETACIVGEFGSGKTATGLSIMRLVPSPGRIVGGEIRLGDVELTRASEQQMEGIRGGIVTMVFQDPRAALDPFFRIGEQLIETVRAHRRVGYHVAREEARHYLDMVKVRNVDRLMDSYPREPSGGECQRAMLAMALLCRPRLLIADEPTSSLDAVVQAEILAMIEDLKGRFGMAVIFITHDFGVVASIADTVTVMYAGHVVESGPAGTVLKDPQHPYTYGLINSVPAIERPVAHLFQIAGQPPDVSRSITGCRFAERCAERVPHCETACPVLKKVGAERYVRCHLRGLSL